MRTASIDVPASELERHRAELTGHCYRMLGSAADAEDAVQETFLRAWRGRDGFEGRSSLRAWLFRIATNVCLDVLDGSQRRVLPMDLGPAGAPDVEYLATRPEIPWLEPMPDGALVAPGGDPADVAQARDTLRLAFVAALQHLPPRQRAVLVLRDALRFPAAEVATLLDTSVASVNSALQRARATMDARAVSPGASLDPLDDEQRELLARYVAAFEAYDMDALTALLAEDAIQSMPPYDMWLTGRGDILSWWFGPGIGCRDSRLVPAVANGSPAFAQYRPDPAGGHAAWALQVLEIREGRIAEYHAFLDVEALFPRFGLPMRFPE